MRKNKKLTRKKFQTLKIKKVLKHTRNSTTFLLEPEEVKLNIQIKNTDNKKQRCDFLAERIKELFMFSGLLIPEKELLKETLGLCEEREQNALSLAPVLGAFGKDYKEIELEARIRKERAECLYELIDCLDRTEKERKEFHENKLKRQKSLGDLMSIFGE